jgi:hypothetical protein
MERRYKMPKPSKYPLDLTEEERAILKDPDWVDEDEADAIMAMRIEKSEGGSAIPIRQYMADRT